MLLCVGAARGDVSTTNPAAIVIFPKVLVSVPPVSATRTDTIVQLTNTSTSPVNVRCFLVNANGHCSNNPGIICNPDDDAPISVCAPFGTCIPAWVENDFAFTLSPGQPTFWSVEAGRPDLNVPPAPENPMRGELKCIEVDDGEAPTDKNDLKGEATIETASLAPAIDLRGYNGIGIQAIAGANDGNDTLVLGTEYNPCPNILILDHFFDDATEPARGDTVRTSLTLVPCSEDFNFQAPNTTTVQYLVFNEFEQRLSTSTSVTCFQELPLSDIDTAHGPGDDNISIFNVAVQGTLTGQTLIRGVSDTDVTKTPGHGLLAVAEEFHGFGGGPGFVALFSDAFNVVQRGTRDQKDTIVLPPAGAPTN
jgi:hypothetical protein